MYNKIIGIIYGGYSSENQISKLSCNNIFNVLKDNYKNLFKVEIFMIDGLFMIKIMSAIL